LSGDPIDLPRSSSLTGSIALIVSLKYTALLDEHMERIQEMFGKRWADALHVAEMFRRATGFVLLDIHPGNIAFAG
jgi:hypothetical protein